GGEERGERPARKSFGAGAGGRSERSSPFASNPSAERRVPSRGARPERREWAPRDEERGERPARKPFGAGAGGPARRGAARPGGEETGEGSKPFVNWRAKKQGPTSDWNSRAPRGAGGPRGAGAPRGRGGPRKGR
ncbi:hypothetical protein Q664_19190, partial [Archangium violaceum Cb vi76]